MGGHARGNSKVKASRKNSNSTKENISLRLRRLSQKRLHGISVPTLSEFHDQPLDILVVSWNVGNKVVSKFFFFFPKSFSFFDDYHQKYFIIDQNLTSRAITYYIFMDPSFFTLLINNHTYLHRLT